MSEKKSGFNSLLRQTALMLSTIAALWSISIGLNLFDIALRFVVVYLAVIIVGQMASLLSVRLLAPEDLEKKEPPRGKTEPEARSAGEAI